jgi:hypothetical protein
MQIIKHRDETIACRLYETDVLTYYANGEIHFTNGGYATNTTHKFATALLNEGASVWAHACWFSSHKGQTTATVRKKTVAIEDGEVLKLKYDKDTGFDFIDPPKMYAYYLKRAPMGMRRKEIELFTEYVLALAKMVDPNDYRPPHQTYAQLTAGELYQMVRNNDDWHIAAEFLLRRCCVMRLGRYRKHVLAHGWTIFPKDIANRLDDMLKYMFCEDLFEKREVDKPNANGNTNYRVGPGAWL